MECAWWNINHTRRFWQAPACAGSNTVQLTVSTVIEIEGGGKPACVAESVLRYIGG